MASRYKAASWRFVAAFWGAVVLVVLKAAHWPNAWSLTHYLFSYEKGFTKRALFGELIRQTLGERRFEEHYLGAVAIGVLGVLACVLLGAAWRRRDQMMVLFLVSPGASYVVYTVGYLDHVLYAIVLAGVVAISKRRDLAPWIAMAVGVMAILVHEGALLSALPLLGVALAVHTRRLAPAGLAIAGCAALACAASLSFALFPVDQAALKTGLAMKANFGLHAVAFPVLSRSFVDCLAELWPYVQAIGAKRIVKLLPLVALFGFWFLDAAWHALAGDPRRRLIFAALVAATAAPLAQFFVAYDYDRWAALAILNAYLGLALVAHGPEDLRFRHPRAVFVMLVIVGSLTSFSQFSGAPLRLPPAFDERIEY